MKKTTKFAALALSACMALGIMCFTACEAEPGKSAYDIWLEQGNTGTEQDFLDSLKGDDGLTPEIKIGTDGYWYIDGQKTDVKAKGENGEPGISPEVTISDDGYWEINGVKTSTKAQGENGEPGDTPEVSISDDGYWEINGVKTSTKAQGESGAPGARGNKIYHGNGKPQIDEAIEGDMYIDIENWNVFFYESDAWAVKGNLKGEVVKYNKIDVKNGSTYTFDVDEEPGVYVVEVDLGDKKLQDGSELKATIKMNNMVSTFVYSETRSEAAGGSSTHNVYYGYVSLNQNVKSLEFSATGEDIAGTVELKTWEMPELDSNSTFIEVPINGNNNTADDIVKFKIKNGFEVANSNKYQLTLGETFTVGVTFKCDNIALANMSTRNGFKVKLNVQGEVEAGTEAYLYMLNTKGLIPGTIKLEIIA